VKHPINLTAGTLYELCDLGIVEAVGTDEGGWALLPCGAALSYFTVANDGSLTEHHYRSMIEILGNPIVIEHNPEILASTDFTVADLTLWEVRA
jgi:hypothetical protein